MKIIFRLVELEQKGLIELGRGKVISKKDLKSSPGEFPVYSSSKTGVGEFGKYGNFMFDEELITWSVDGGGRLFYREKHKFSITNVSGFLRIIRTDLISYKYLYHCLTYLHSKISFDWVKKAHPSVLRKEYNHIPLPSLSIQKQIVEKLDAAFADIDKAISATEKNIENAEALFQSSLIKIFKNPEFKYLELEKVCNISGGGTPSKKNKSFYEGKIPWATVRDMKNDFIYDTEFKITDDAIKKSSTNLIPGGNVVIATRVGLGKVSIISCDTAINQDLKGIIPKREGLLDINFLFFWFKSISKVIIDAGTGATVQGVKLPFVKSLRIPNIDISLQRQLSSNIKQISEQNELLVSIYNQKLNHLTGLKSSLLNQAFSGELTKDVA